MLRSALDGKTWFAAPADDNPAVPVVTARQWEVLRALALGMRTTAIAELLGISAKGVEAHLDTLFERFDVRTRTGLVMQAIAHGVLDLPADPRPWQPPRTWVWPEP